MKMKRPAYFSVAFLVLFLSSFSTNVYSSYNNSLKSDVHYSKSNEVKQNTSDSATESLVFEETENDSEDAFEDGYEVQSFLPPFLVSFFSFEVSTPLYTSVEPLTEKVVNPIYIAVRNFRI